LDGGRWTEDVGRRMMNSERRTMDGGRWTIEQTIIRTKTGGIDGRQTDNYKRDLKTLNEDGKLNSKTKRGVDSMKRTQNGYKRRGQEQNETTTPTTTLKRYGVRLLVGIEKKVKRNAVVGPINQWDQAYIRYRRLTDEETNL
jgi:hypothetical protein